MKRFLLKLLIFAALLAAADALAGVALKNLRDKGRKPTGELSLSTEIAYKADPEVVILGSSRGQNHYVPSIIGDSLGMKCFNAGEDGCGIILAYTRYRMLASRLPLKLVVVDIEPNFFIYGDDLTADLAYIRPYYDDFPFIRGLFGEFIPNENYKKLSQSYRYNSQLLHLISETRYPKSEFDGFEPITLPASPILHDLASREEIPSGKVNPQKMELLRRMIEDCRAKGTQVVLAFSPHFGRTDSREFGPVKDMARRYGVPVLDHFADTTYVAHEEYFANPPHMRDYGARIYSSQIGSELKQILRAAPQTSR